MAIKKIALIDATIDEQNIVPFEKIASSDAVTARFRKVADQLRDAQKKAGVTNPLCPKVEDFVFAHAIMMHAAEAALIDQETGNPILNKSGTVAVGKFIEAKDGKGQSSLKWDSPDGVLPYRNGNGDIFPEADLIKAHKEWVGKPLCKDHISNSVDGVRGIVVDTHYDPKFKRVHALFALDKKNYPDLARKVEAGYATSVSMGTAVGRSICSECSNVATVEAEYCNCVRNKTCHGEVNVDLSPIELSIVVTGADPKAKILTVLASLQNYQKQVAAVAAGKGNFEALKNVKSGLDAMAEDLGQVENTTMAPSKTEDEAVKEIEERLDLLKDKDIGPELRAKGKAFVEQIIKATGKSILDFSAENQAKIMRTCKGADIDLNEKDQILSNLLNIKENKISDIQPGLRDNSQPAGSNLVNSNGYGLSGAPETGAETGQAADRAFASLYTERAKDGNRLDAASLANKIADLKRQIIEIEQSVNEEKIMSFADLKKKRLERKAYWQGTEEPTPGKPQYPSMGDQDKLREKEDRHMQQDGKMGGNDGMVPGDEQAKKIVQRAELEERRARRAAWLKSAADKVTVVQTKTGPKAIDPQGNMLASDGKTAAKKDEDKDEEKDDKKDDKKDEKKEDKKDDDKKDKKDDKDSKKDDDKDDKKNKNPFAKKDDDKDDKKTEKKAYFQGTEEPTPGKSQYPLMGDQDKLREKEDRQMQQTGNMGGDDGMVPGDEDTKRKLQRTAGKISANLYKGADSAKSRWVFSANGNKVLEITAAQAYGEALNKKFNEQKTFADLFHTKDYGSRVMSMLRNEGLDATAAHLGIKVAADMPGVPPAAPAPEAPPAPPADAPPAPGADKGADDKIKDLGPLVTKLEEVLAEIQEVVGSKATPEEEGLGEVDVDAGAAVPPPPAPGAEVQAARVSDRDMLEAYAFVNDTCNELCFIEGQVGNGNTSATQVAEQAVADAQVAYDEAKALVTAYAAQKKATFLAKRAARRQALVAKANDAAFVLDDAELGQVEDKLDEGLGDHEDAMHDDGADGDVADIFEHLEEGDAADLALDAPAACADDGLAQVQMAVDYNSLDTTARKAWRENLVKSAGEYLDIYEKARKGGGHKLENLNMKVSDEADKIETLDEIHDKMMDVATKPMAKVKSAAEKLDKWIRSGGINADKLDNLVAAGAVDSEVAKYWKQFYGQADGGKEFAASMIKEFDGKKKATASANTTEEVEVRIHRAYQLGLEAQKKGVIGHTTADLGRYVDTLKKLPDEQFNALKAHVEIYRAPQGLVSAPVVGINDKDVGSNDGDLNKTASANYSPPTFENLSKIWG
jgi:hypothetical protein